MHRLGQKLLFQLEPEQAHRIGIGALKSGLLPTPSPIDDPRLRVELAGLALPNPVGVAAGFDKDAEVPDALLKLGFGYTEIGTVTPKPQTGNPKPRVFRLPKDQGVINRLGFNNGGHEAAYQRLKSAKRLGIIGVNIGANKDADDRAQDYVAGLNRFYDLASYFTVNISSPNTPGLRDLQARGQLADLLKRVADARAQKMAHGAPNIPVFLKIAPDVTEADLDDIVAEVLANGIDGIIVSNTTLSRHGLTADTAEAGGLSGRPLFERATIMLAKTRQRAGNDLAIIGVGGVDSAETAKQKIEAGADAVQLYSAMIYAGPKLAHTINRGLRRLLDRDGVNSVRAWRDTQLAHWANQTPR
ncbi:MAG: quinone-dependent dihydroorotate dehydrogenase [Ahrensia sp.]